MKKLFSILAGALLTLGLAHAQVSGNYWKLQGTTLSPLSSGWTVNTGSGGATSTFGYITATTTTATSTFAGNVQVSGDLRVLGNFYAPVSIVSAGNINPSASVTYSLGTSALRWLNVYASVLNVSGASTLATTTFGGYVTVATSSIVVPEYQWSTATSTTMTVDWKKANTQNIILGSAGVTITFANATTTLGAVQKLVICNPAGASGGTITWGTTIIWSGGTAPTQTTTANKCDVWSFISTNATGTARIFGSASTGF